MWFVSVPFSQKIRGKVSLIEPCNSDLIKICCFWFKVNEISSEIAQFLKRSKNLTTFAPGTFSAFRLFLTE